MTPRSRGHATSYMVAISNHRALTSVLRGGLVLIPKKQPGLPGCESVWVTAKPGLGGTDCSRQEGHRKEWLGHPKQSIRNSLRSVSA